MKIETTRLQLQPFAPQDLLALIDSAEQCEARMGLRLAEGLREFFVSGEIPSAWIESLRSANEPDPWVHGFAVVDAQQKTIVGSAGFKGAPDDDGSVEIAYAIVPSCEGRGYATEVAGALVQFASTDSRVRVVLAHTLPELNASTRVLTKCGFEKTGEIEDPDDGTIWRWQRAAS